MTNLLPWTIWLAPIVGALLTPVFAKVHSRLRDLGAISFVFLAAVSATLVALFVPSGDYSVPWIPALSVQAGVLVDPLSMFMVNIVAWVSFLIMIYSVGYMKGDSGLTRYWFFMCLFIGNMLLLVLADNLLMMLFGWEGVGLCSYALIDHWYKDEKEHWVGTLGETALGVPQAYSPGHAGMKAFLFTRVGDIALMIAIFLIYAFSGTFSYTALASQMGWAADLARLGLLLPTALLFFGGPIGKSAQFPLQEWLPDAMAGPTSVSALIHAATMVKAGVFLTGRMGPIFYVALAQFNQVYPFFATIAWIGAFTAFLAATQASVAREIKKVLAYSTVSQIGYMMLALGVAGLSVDFAAGYTAGLFHLMSHAIFKASLFLAAGWVLHASETRFMDQMGGLARSMRITAAAMLLAGLSLMGIPPLSGFWTKDAILAATFGADQLALSRYALYGLGIVTVALTAFYTMRMLGMTFTGRPSPHLEELEQEGKHIHEANLVMLIPYLFLAVASLVLGLSYPFISQRLTNYVVGTFSILPSSLPSGPVNESTLLSLALIGGSVGAALIGAGLGYLFYFNRERNPPGEMRGLRKFLWNRWYINAVYYKVFLNGTLAASRGLYRYIEQGIWDKLSYVVARDVVDYSKISQRVDTGVVDAAVNNVASEGSRLSNLFRRLQNGVTEQYIIAFAIGIFLLLAWMLFVIGVS